MTRWVKRIILTDPFRSGAERWSLAGREISVPMGRPSLRILHTSDFHIGNHDSEDRRILTRTIGLAAEHRANLLIIAGDLFDHNRVGEDLVLHVADALEAAPCPVFIIAGNHDCLTARSVFYRFGVWRESRNIRIFRGADGETVHQPHLGAVLWGKSIDYDDRDVNPLEGMPAPEPNGNWNIAIAHGYYVGDNPVLFPSYHINEEEITGLNWDYIALGHVPTFKHLNSDPMTYYSGSPSLTKTAALVDMDEATGVVVRRCEL